MESWRDSAGIYLDRRILVILFLGFSSGLPFLLVFSTLSIWLKLEGVSLTAIGLFSLVRTPYTFKFLWAPLIDRVPLPVLSRLLGRRRSWAILTQAALMAAIFAMASTSPSENAGLTALFALFVAFASASQDIVIDAYRVEILEDDRQAAGAGVLVLGYRVGLLTAGAGALWLASVLSWQAVYGVMAGLVAVGMITILLAPEPETGRSLEQAEAEEDRIARHLEAGLPHWASRLLAWLYEAVVAPFGDFMTRSQWAAVLAFIAVLFAFSTMISWSYYGEQCWVRLFGIRTIMVYKGLFLLFVWLGAVFNASSVIDFGDAMILGMAFPNLVGVVLLSGRIKRELDTYLGKLRAGDLQRY